MDTRPKQPSSTMPNEPGCAELGLIASREIEGLGIVGIMPFLFTWGLCVRVNPGDLANFYSYRFCYPDLQECLADFWEWSGEGLPAGNWIKQKGSGLDVSNPNYTDTV